MLGKILLTCAMTAFLIRVAAGQPAGPEAEAVLKVEEALVTQGYNPGEIDGVLTPETEDALRRFQRDHELAATGEIDRNTWERLELEEDDYRQWISQKALPPETATELNRAVREAQLVNQKGTAWFWHGLTGFSSLVERREC